MVNPPETLPAGPTLTPQQQLEQLRTNIQNARNAPPVTTDQRTTLQNNLNALRAEASLDQAELDRLDREIQTLPTPPPSPQPSIEDALSASGMPLDTAQRQQIRQATGFFTKMKKGIFMLLGSIPFLRKWAQKHLKEMGMEEYADELRSPEEKKKAEDEKRNKEEDQRRQEADRTRQQTETQRVTSLNERIREKPDIDQALHTYALAKAMRRFSTGVGGNFTAENERLDLAGRANVGDYKYKEVAQNIIDWLKAESGRPIFGLEIDGGDLEEADGSNWFADYDLIVNFEEQLRTAPKTAFTNLKNLELKQSMNKTAGRMLPELIKAMNEELARYTNAPVVSTQPSAGTPPAPRPAAPTTPVAPASAPSNPPPPTTPTP